MRVEKVPSDMVRVTVIFEACGIKPVWFEANGQKTSVEKVCYTWSYHEGAATILNFAVWDGVQAWELAYNVMKGSWTVKAQSIAA
jgi:hypothetical protein